MSDDWKCGRCGGAPYEPQPEPTDAQLIEARADFRNDPDSDGLTLGEAFNTGWSAALRAANEVR